MISLRRLRALVRKEFLQIRRDPSSILIAFVLPVLLLFIFGYGVSLDAQRMPLGVVVEESSAAADEFVSAMLGSRYFELTVGSDPRPLFDQLSADRLRGVVILRQDFADTLAQDREAAPIEVITDGSNPQIAAFVENYVRGAWGRWQDLRREEAGLTTTGGIVVEPRFWFNPSLESRNYLVPGSIAIVMTVIGTLLTALVIAREWERGTMEALLASPVTRAELLLGKLIPYFVLGILSFAACVAVSVGLFGVPLRGSLGMLFLLTTAFLLCALGLGLTISAATKNQFLASQAAINAAFLPAFLLSGFIFEIRSMPDWIQAITQVIPARYFVSGLQTIFMAGDHWTVIAPQLGALLILAAILLTATAKKIQRRLD